MAGQIYNICVMPTPLLDVCVQVYNTAPVHYSMIVLLRLLLPVYVCRLNSNPKITLIFSTHVV